MPEPNLRVDNTEMSEESESHELDRFGILATDLYLRPRPPCRRLSLTGIFEWSLVVKLGTCSRYNGNAKPPTYHPTGVNF